jgi:pimeloyl-ACP methyl ester carboxylesterase
MQGFFRPWQVAALALLLAGTALALVTRAGVTAQAQAVVVLSTTLETPVLTWAVAQLTAEPDVGDTRIAGAATTFVKPAGAGPWDALVIVNGAALLGRREPALQRFVRGLGRAGYLVALPELPGLADGRITERSLRAVVEIAAEMARRPDTRDGRVGLVGVSVGTTLALLATQDPTLERRISFVAGTAPYADLTTLLRLATTGTYREGSNLVPYEIDPFLAVAVARSLAAVLPPGPEREALVAATDDLDDRNRDPLASLRGASFEGFGAEAEAVIALLRNRDPRRFDELYGALPVAAQAAIKRLSPIENAHRLDLPVELASAPKDKYVPPSESRSLVRGAPNARLTITSTLAHAEPEPSLGALRDLLRFDGWVIRSLQAAAD